MRQLNKKGAGEEQSNTVYAVLAIAFLVVGIFVIYIYIIKPLMGTKQYTPDNLATVVQACNIACDSSDKVTYCSTVRTLTAMTDTQEVAFIANGHLPVSKICKTSSDCDTVEKYHALKGNNQQTFSDLTCKDLRSANILTTDCQTFSC